MKNFIKSFFDVKKMSFFLTILPFVTFNSVSLFNSHFFNLSKLCFLFFLLIFIDLSLKIILENLRAYKIFSIFFFSAIVIFFYGFYLTAFFQDFFSNYLDLFLRGRTILFFSLLILIGIQLKLNKIYYFKFINYFFIIFSIVNFSVNFNEFTRSKLDLDQFLNNFHHIDISNKSKKPIILIITDEYSSPDEFFRLYNDSSVFKFSNYLANNNWVVKNSSFSNETSTIHSVSSLFNFNLSNRLNYSEANMYDVGSEKLLHSSFYDSLNLKGVDFINFGIFRVGDKNPLNKLYKYPESFFEVFMFNTIYDQIFLLLGGLNLECMDNKFYAIEAHNKFVLNTMPDSLNKFSDNIFFAYVHLYMPHSPFLFSEEIDKPLSKDTRGYFEYWKFTNKKLEVLLKELSKSGEFRIILSGDHGFREDSKINPKNTFTAFYGFSEKDLTTIKSVQDLGILINACY